jgi:hypothetical protein
MRDAHIGPPVPDRDADLLGEVVIPKMVPHFSLPAITSAWRTRVLASRL